MEAALVELKASDGRLPDASAGPGVGVAGSTELLARNLAGRGRG